MSKSGNLIAVPAERENYEKWITQTTAYMDSSRNQPTIIREKVSIPCGDETNNSFKVVNYAATFNW